MPTVSHLRSWLLFRLFGWGSPSLHAIGHTETLRWVITGKTSDADGESLADAALRGMRGQ